MRLAPLNFSQKPPLVESKFKWLILQRSRDKLLGSIHSRCGGALLRSPFRNKRLVPWAAGSSAGSRPHSSALSLPCPCPGDCPCFVIQGYSPRLQFPGTICIPRLINSGIWRSGLLATIPLTVHPSPRTPSFPPDHSPASLFANRYWSQECSPISLLGTNLHLRVLLFWKILLEN